MSVKITAAVNKNLYDTSCYKRIEQMTIKERWTNVRWHSDVSGFHVMNGVGDSFISHIVEIIEMRSPPSATTAYPSLQTYVALLPGSVPSTMTSSVLFIQSGDPQSMAANEKCFSLT